ncbi:tyrosine-type recombinase/integrase [Chloroflexota bacterium]
MFLKLDTRRTIEKTFVDDYLFSWMEAFLIDRKANGVAPGTLRFYRIKLLMFIRFCETQAINQISQITPRFIRQFLLYLEEAGHNPGGKHAVFRALRAFFLWYEEEIDQKEWSNPIRKVKAPRVPVEPIEPVSIKTISNMIKVCKKGTFTGDRDTTMFQFLLDTGVRANELLDINIEDVDQPRGEVLIRRGKGSKPRTVYFGKQTRRSLRKYLNHRNDNCHALWIKHPRFGPDRLSYDGLREILKRRASSAKVEKPTPHDFRRAFALSMLRNGTDVFTLAKLMGHSGITVLQRYLMQTNFDTEIAHRRVGPVDNAGL